MPISFDGTSAVSKAKTGVDNREGEAPAEPLRQLAHIDLAARREPRPPNYVEPRFSFDKPLARLNVNAPRSVIRFSLEDHDRRWKFRCSFCFTTEAG